MRNVLPEAPAAYIAELYGEEDDILRTIRAEILRRDLPGLIVRPEEGRMLQLLVRLINARKVVEIGTLAGYSAVWLSRGMAPDGVLYTLEINPEHADVAREMFALAGLADRVQLRMGNAHEVLRDLEREGPFDATFIDADKEGYPAYLEWSLRHVRPGGLILAHNALRGGRVADPTDNDAAVRATQTYNRLVAENAALLSTIIPIGDGTNVALVMG